MAGLEVAGMMVTAANYHFKSVLLFQRDEIKGKQQENLWKNAEKM